MQEHAGPLKPFHTCFSSTESFKHLYITFFVTIPTWKIKPYDIYIPHQLDRPPINGADQRNIMKKFCGRDFVGDVCSACKQHHPLSYANCSLILTRKEVFNALRLLKNRFPTVIKRCRSWNGVVQAFTTMENEGLLQDTGGPSQGKSQLRHVNKQAIINLTLI